MGIGIEDLQGGTKWWGGKGCGVGAKISGIVVTAEQSQQQDFDTGVPMEWENGDARMESVIVLSDTGEVDPETDNDDGTRALHLRGGNYEVVEGSGTAGEAALKEAINKSGIRCDTGVKVTAVISGMGKATGRGKNPPKLWTIKLEKTQAGIGEEDLFGDD
jgi:hypothetical protein